MGLSRRAMLIRGLGLGASALLGAGPASLRAAAPMPLFDAHLHYSHDAWDTVPVAQAVQLLRAAGLKGALVSSSDDEGTQRLHALAPDLVVPELRPYRTRADLSTWVRDEGVVRYLEQRLARFRYAGIGEFHLFGADADLPVPRRMVALARERALLLHAHSDAEAVDRLFAQWPQARILWAHAGFEPPGRVREVLRRHRQLWCDLAFRSDPAAGGRVEAGWREAFAEFPDRFLVGTDTFTPERWHYVGPHARWAREWLADLAPSVAEGIAWRNAQAMLGADPLRGGEATTASESTTCEEVAGEAPAHSILRAQGHGPTQGLLLMAAPRPAPLAVGRHFGLSGRVCGGARITRVDADMPAHRHGMNYRPTLTAGDDGRFEAVGLMLHMPGDWRLRFEVERAGQRAWMDVPVTLR